MAGLAAGGEPGTDELANLSKVVFSSTLKAPLSWANTRLVTDDRFRAVRDMKERRRVDAHDGKPDVCRSLLGAGLVDRFRVVVFPVITGRMVGIGSTTATPTSTSIW